MGDNFFRYAPKFEENQYDANRPLTSTADVLAAMKDPRYKSDPGYRKAVQQCMKLAQDQGGLKKLDPSTQTLESAMTGNSGQIVENVKEQSEAIVSMMSDPRYKTSATYRKQVAAVIAQSDPRHLTDLGGPQRYDSPYVIPGPFDPSKPEPGSNLQ